MLLGQLFVLFHLIIKFVGWINYRALLVGLVSNEKSDRNWILTADATISEFD